MPRDLAIGERVVVRKALAAAIGLCDAVINASDQALGDQVAALFNLRPTAQRLAGLRREFQNVKNALAQTNPDNCNRVEGGNYYAQVNPAVPYRITFGDDFFSASLRGIDSRAGALIHEATHWNIVRGSDDHAYGDADMQRLSATLARNNADSLERIAERIQ